MASTITSGTLKVTLTESITLNGAAQGSTSTLSIPSINEISKRIVTITTSEASILTFGAAAGVGTYIKGDVRYLRFKNLDDTNYIILTFIDSNSSAEVKVKLDALQSFIYNADNAAGIVTTLASGASGIADTLYDLVTVQAIANTASCDLEIFVASA
tara:strand:+ start:618 stop:1088 length:471 start_codon:yes stop_codon:yes gene_type:complete